jgi:hypothetical protein
MVGEKSCHLNHQIDAQVLKVSSLRSQVRIVGYAQVAHLLNVGGASVWNQKRPEIFVAPISFHSRSFSLDDQCMNWVSKLNRWLRSRRIQYLTVNCSSPRYPRYLISLGRRSDIDVCRTYVETITRALTPPSRYSPEKISVERQTTNGKTYSASFGFAFHLIHDDDDHQLQTPKKWSCILNHRVKRVQR